MILGLSPPVRRVVALGILLLLLLSALSLAGSLANAVGEALTQLEDARFRAARLASLSKRPPPTPGETVPEDLLFHGPDLETVQGDFAGRIAAAAANAQLAIEPLPALPRDSLNKSLLRLPVAVSGPEQAVLTFVNQLEQGRPAVRMSRWRMAPATDPAHVQLEGVAIAAWMDAR